MNLTSYNTVIRISAFCLIFMLSCSASSKRTGPSVSLLELHNRIDYIQKQNDSLKYFSADGFFIYKDKKMDLNLGMKVKYDKTSKFSRILFFNNIDNSVWGDLVVFKNSVSLYFPTKKTLYKGKIDNFNLYPFTRINIQLSEILKLAFAKVYFINNFKKAGARDVGKYFLLYIKNSELWQKLYFEKKTLNISKIQIYKKNKEKALLRYAYYKLINGNNIPMRSELHIRKRGLRVISWYSKVFFKYRYKTGDEILNLPVDIIIHNN